MMPTEHDEALVERVALALLNTQNDACRRERISERAARNNIVPAWMDAARAVIYPPAPPKTRLQVARELLAAELNSDPFDRKADAELVSEGMHDSSPSVRAVLAALALPAMED